MPVSGMKERGFTLIELMVALAIAVILLVLAAPLYATWIADAQVRSAAESVGSGLRIAMNEAMKSNTSVEFVLDPTTKTGGWVVQPPGGGTTFQQASFADGVERAVFTVAPAGRTIVTFNGLGQVAATNADASLPFDRIDINTGLAGERVLRVLVGGGRTGVKICDPAWPASDPKGCPNVGG